MRRASSVARKTSNAKRRRRAIVVLGMHRSGTSALARVLGLCGATLPKRLMAPGPDNEAGFWEPNEIVAIHDRLLFSVGSRWDDITEFPRDWCRSDVAEVYKQEIVDALKEDYGDAQLIVVKDPRICRLVPFWVDVLAAYGAEPSFVILVRNPLEVAASLKARDNFPLAKSLVLWLRHVLSAERDTRGGRRSFVTYDVLLSDWRKVVGGIARDLAISFPRQSYDSVHEIGTFLSNRLRHHTVSHEELQVRPDVADWVKSTFRWLSARHPGAPEQYGTVNRVYTELQKAERVYGPYLEALARDQREKQARAEVLQRSLLERDNEITSRDRAAAERDTQLSTLERAVSERDARVASFEQAVAGLDTALAVARQAAEAQGSEIAHLTKAVERLRSGVGERDEQVASLAQRIAERDQALAGARKEAGHQLAEVASLQVEVSARDRQVVELNQATAELELQLTGLRKSLETQQEVLGERDARLTQLAEFVAEREGQVDELTQAVAKRDRQITDLKQEVAERDAELRTVQGETAVQRAEIAELTETMVVLQAQLAEQKAQIASSTLTLVEREQALSTAREEAESQQVKMDHLNEAVAEGNRQVVELNQATAELELQLTGLRKSLETQQEVLGERDARLTQLAEFVAEREGQVDELTQAVAKRDRQITDLKQEVAERDAELRAAQEETAVQRAEIADLSETMVALQAQLAEQEAQIASSTLTLAERERALSAARKEAENWGTEIAQLKSVVSERDSQVSEILSSTSWMLSAPARMIGRLLKRRERKPDGTSERHRNDMHKRAVRLHSKYNVDHLVIKGRRIYGWGWIFSEQRGIAKLFLIANGDTHSDASIKCSYGLRRSDVAAAHPAFEYAKHSGFVVSGWLPDGSTKELAINAVYQDGASEQILLGSPSSYLSKMKSGRTWEIYRLGKQGLRFLVRGDITGLTHRAVAKVAAHTKGRNTTPIEPLALIALLKQVTSPQILIVDHNMGGGANFYRERVIQERCEKGQTVLLIYYDLPALDYYIRIIAPDRDEKFRLDSFASLLDVGRVGGLQEVIVNNLVSLDEPLEIVALLPLIRELTGARLTIAVHDYFPICPSWTLLDCDGHFCGVPGIERCHECLPDHRGQFTALVQHRNIDSWRERWRQCLDVADTILCFSTSSMELMGRAYPSIDPAKFHVKPHTVEYLSSKGPSVNLNASLNIGVVGEITEHKGASIVKEMAELISARNLPVKITVIGTISELCATSAVSITGPYKREELGTLIETQGVNVCFVPSIWPETFSYTTEELLKLEVPLAVFSIGAPAERVRKYSRGLLIEDVSASSALENIRNFYNTLRMIEGSNMDGATDFGMKARRTAVKGL